jgi:hypothetical protein
VASIDADDLPSLDDAFNKEGYGGLLKVLTQAGFKSIAPLMALPTESLLDIPGIGLTNVSLIDRVLQRNGLERRCLNEGLFPYLDRQFGRVEDAPVGVLQIVVVRNGATNWSLFAPLEIVNVLERKDNPRMRIRDLMMVDSDDIRRSVKAQSGLIHDLSEDIIHLKRRLNGLSFDFAVLRAADLAAFQQQ